MNKKIRPKKCAWCKEKFAPDRPFQPCCCIWCAIQKLIEDKAKKEEKRRKERLRGIERRTDKLSRAQDAFNVFIRYRDKDKPCIVCGTMHNAQYQAGHFYTRAARPDLRFNENNCFKQCAQTNKFTSIDTAEKFKSNVIARIGIEEFEKLKVRGYSEWNSEEIEAIEKLYKLKLRELKNG